MVITAESVTGVVTVGLLALAIFVRVVPLRTSASTRTWISTRVLLPEASVPTAQVTTPELYVHPSLAPTNVVLTGSESVITTLDASDGPRLVGPE